MSLPFDWDFLQDNLPPEKHAELRRQFMEEWRSGEYTKKRATRKKLSPPKRNAQKKKIWDVRSGVRKITIF